MMRLRVILCSFLLTIMIALPSNSVDFFVRVDGSNDADGQSWGTAKRTIQAAISAAVLNGTSSVDTVFVKGYTGETSYNEHIEMVQGISIKGGYTGNLNDPYERLEGYITVISATGLINYDDCVIHVPTDVLRATILDRLTIQNGVGRQVSSYRYGGGIYCEGSPTIRNCHILNNSAQYGGGICATTGTHPSITENTIIESNSTTSDPYGAGVFWYGGNCTDSIIRNNTNQGVYFGSYSNMEIGDSFSRNEVTGNKNTSPGSGWGVALFSSSVSITDNIINDNGYWGIYAVYSNPVTIQGNTISGHGVLSTSGGGLFLQGSVGEVSENTITGNQGVSTGGIYIYSSGSPGSLNVCRNAISENTTARNGGGIFWTGTGPAAVYSNLIKSNNSVGTAGNAVYIDSLNTSKVFANNTIIDNTSSGTTPSAVYLSNPSGGYLSNNIIANNVGTGIYQSGGTYYRSKNCLFNNGIGGSGHYYPSQLPGSDIINQDPGFNTDGYHLLVGSPCIDVGDDSVFQEAPPFMPPYEYFDIDGEIRQFEISGTGIAQVDIGADEYNNTIPPAPLNVTDDGDYTTDNIHLHASWIKPQYTGVLYYKCGIGYGQSSPDVLGWQDAITDTSATLSVPAGLTDGTTYYFLVKAVNSAGIESSIGASDGIIVDTSAPSAPTNVNDDGTYTTIISQFHASWDAATDNHSGISRYKYEIRTSPDGFVVRSGTTEGPVTNLTDTGLSLVPNATYKFYVSAVNGAGLESVWVGSDGIKVNISGPAVGPLTLDTGTQIGKYAKFEASFNISGLSNPFTDYNPFNPNTKTPSGNTKYWNKKGVLIDALLVSPENQIITYPCFWYKSGIAKPWKVRFAPTAEGTWKLRIRICYSPDNQADEYTISDEYTFSCVPRSSRGFIRVSSQDPRFFEFEDGTPFYPIGCGTEGWDVNNGGWVNKNATIFERLRLNSGNFARIFAVRGDNAVERYWTSGSQRPELLTIYNYNYPNNTDILDDHDQVVESAETNGIYLMWLIDNHTYFKNTENPYIYKSINEDGPCANLKAVFFGNTLDGLNNAWEIYQRKLRYIAARWGYSKNIVAWELMNEVGAPDNKQCKEWHRVMSHTLKGDFSYVAYADDTDPNNDRASRPGWLPPNFEMNLGDQPHLVTSSHGSTILNSIKGIPWDTMDIVNYHDYCRVWRDNDNLMLWSSLDTKNGEYDWEPMGIDIETPPATGLPFLRCPWMDTSVWVDRLARVKIRPDPAGYGWDGLGGEHGPLMWSEFGLGTTDWTDAYNDDTTGRHYRDALWAGLFTHCTVLYWKSAYLLGYYGGGSDKFSIYQPLAAFIAGEDLRNLEQETRYIDSDPTNLTPKITCSNPKIMAMCLYNETHEGTTTAFLYAKNLTDTWYRDIRTCVVNTDVLERETVTGTITIPGLKPGSYMLETWNPLSPTPPTTQSISVTDDGSGNGTVKADITVTLNPAVTDAYAYKLKKQ